MKKRKAMFPDMSLAGKEKSLDQQLTQTFGPELVKIYKIIDKTSPVNLQELEFSECINKLQEVKMDFMNMAPPECSLSHQSQELLIRFQ